MCKLSQNKEIVKQPKAVILVFLKPFFCLVLFPLMFNALKADEVEMKRVLFLGDSITAGYGLNTEASYPSLIESKFNAHGLKFQVVNAGVSGDTTAGGLRRIDWLLQNKVHVLVIALGANDGLRGVPVSETRRNLKGIVHKARDTYPEIKIVLAGMKMPKNMGKLYIDEYEKMFYEIAKEEDLSIIPFLLQGVATMPQYNLTDGIHPNAEGQRIVAENVWKVIKPILLEGQP
jgi:acyl-CoA thioesterase I